MEQLFDLFQKAPTLGSLINPRRIGDLLVAEFHELQPLLEQALGREKVEAASSRLNPLRDQRQDAAATFVMDETLAEMGVTARGLAHAAEILGGQFTLVATNVPYLGQRKQDDVLKNFCERHHPDAKADLATCFVERCLDFCAAGGSTALVTPQNWLFLTSYRRLRQHLLEKNQWAFAAKLGPGAFESISGAVVNVALLGLTRSAPNAEHQISGLDALQEDSSSAKDRALQEKNIARVTQVGQLSNPDARIVFEEPSKTPVSIPRQSRGLYARWPLKGA
jgi:hypothetical protein